jgi:propanol-preferring alcohol dehydrogenase
MRAMLLESPHRPLRAADVPTPDAPGPGQVLVEVATCGVCRTDLHLLDGEVGVPDPPVIPGHQIVGRVLAGEGFEPGARVGVPWLGWTCGECRFCTTGRENLCPRARFTGRDVDGGFAEYAVADRRYAFPLPDGPSDVELAPLLCAGLIGYRALRMCGDATRLGLYGFGAAAHIICQVALRQGRRVFAVSRGDMTFARQLGAEWTGSPSDTPPEPLEAIIIFAPAGELVPIALKHLAPGGTVVCAGIHMSDIPSFPYEDLWHERSIRSVANLTRADGHEFLQYAPHVRTRVTTYPLEQTYTALSDLRAGRFAGAAVVIP